MIPGDSKALLIGFSGSRPTVGAVEEQRFGAMGSDVHVVVVGGPTGLVERAHERIDDLERRWSLVLAPTEGAARAR